MIAQTVENVLAKGTATFSWRELVSARAADRRRQAAPSSSSSRSSTSRRWSPARPRPTRSGRRPSTSILRSEYGARVRLTGPVPIANEEFATVKDGALVNGIGTVRGRAVHSLDGAAFGEDHLRGVRQSVRRPRDHHRGRPDDGRLAEPAVDRLCGAVRRPRRRFRHPVQRPLPLRALQDRRPARRRWCSAAEHVRAVPLSLAAMATAAGFLSFLPTDYKGISELGKIAGAGMADRVPHQHHGAAGADQAAQSARREGAARLRLPGAARSLPREAPHRDHRRHAAASRSPACRCCISAASTSTRSTCATRRSNRSRPSSICARIRNTGANTINVLAPSEEAATRRSRPSSPSCRKCRAA